MALFNTDYYHSMDKDYFVSMDSVNEAEAPAEPRKRASTISVKEMGSTVIDGPNAGRFSQSIEATMRKGVGRIELTPIPSGRGMGGGEVEAYGKEERREIKELAKINEVEMTSIHVPHQVVYNLSGLGQRGFSEEQRSKSIEEIKKHIDFAADTMEGGSIVFHTGEFPRSISQAKWNREISGNKMFEGYPGEEKEAIHYLVDAKTGEIVKTVKEDEVIYRPVPATNPDGTIKYVLDSEGKRIPNPVTNEPIPDYVYDKQTGNIKIVPETYDKFRDRFVKENPGVRVSPEKIAIEFFREQQRAQVQYSLGQAQEYEMHYVEGLKNRKKLLDSLNFYKKALAGVPKEERWKHKIPTREGMLGVPENLDPVDYLEEQFRNNERKIAYGREIAVSGLKQAHEMQRKLKSIQPIGEYAFKKSINSIAELGAFAMRETASRKLRKDIYLTPENMMPEMGYGSHPEELIELVETARKKMVERLTREWIPDPSGRLNDDGSPIMVKSPDYSRGMSEERAKKEAESHIKCTLDTAHLGLWYKHFKGSDPRMSEEQRMKEFQGWYLKEVKKLADKGIVGNVHVVDTFGRADSHLAAGKGMMPVIEAVEYLKSKGVTSISSEGFEDMREQVTGPWSAFGSPIYSVGRGNVSFGEIQNSYFGRANPPPYVFGHYRPTEDWGWWSGVPLD